MKVLIFLFAVLATVMPLPHHIPDHVGETDPVLLVIPGVPVSVHGDGEGYLLKEFDIQGQGASGVVVPGTKIQGSLIVAPELPGARLISLKDPAFHARRRRGTGFSYTAPDGTTRSEQLETYVDPRVKDGHALNRVRGQVSWTSPEGKRIVQNYVADGSGYHVLSSHR